MKDEQENYDGNRKQAQLGISLLTLAVRQKVLIEEGAPLSITSAAKHDGIHKYFCQENRSDEVLEVSGHIQDAEMPAEIISRRDVGSLDQLR